MVVYIYDNKFLTTKIKHFNFQFDLHKNFDKNIEHELYHIIRRNQFLTEQRIKKRG